VFRISVPYHITCVYVFTFYSSFSKVIGKNLCFDTKHFFVCVFNVVYCMSGLRNTEYLQDAMVRMILFA